MTGARKRIILACVLLLAAGLRLWQLDKYPLWYDEAQSAMEDNILMPPPSLEQAFHPQPDTRYDFLFVFEHRVAFFWKSFAPYSVFWLRSFSAIAGIVSVGLVYALAARMFGPLTGLAAAFLTAVSPMHLQYSREFRPYIFVFLLTVCAAMALFSIYRKGKRLSWLLYALCLAAIVYTKFPCAAVLAGSVCALFLMRKWRRWSWGDFLWSHLLFLVLVTPVVLSLIPNMVLASRQAAGDMTLSNYPMWAGHIGLANLILTLKTFAVGYYLSVTTPAGFFGALCFFILFGYGVYGRKGFAARMCWAMALAPAGAVFVFNQFSRFGYVDRYFIIGLPFFLILTASVLSAWKGFLRVCAFLGCAVFCCLGIAAYDRDILSVDYVEHAGVIPKDTEIDRTASFVARGYREGDVVFFNSKMAIYPVRFCFRRLAAVSPGAAPAGLLAEAEKGALLWDDRGSLQVITHGKAPDFTRTSALDRDALPGRFWIIGDRQFSHPRIRAMAFPGYVESSRCVFKGSEAALYSREAEE